MGHGELGCGARFGDGAAEMWGGVGHGRRARSPRVGGVDGLVLEKEYASKSLKRVEGEHAIFFEKEIVFKNGC